MQVLNSSLRNFFDETPLILIDGIPISDLNIIKDMGTSDIDRVDICTSERYYGDLRFPGVVAIYTFKGDYSRIPASDQLIRLKLETMQANSQLATPEINEPNIPDLRQLLYWNPSAKPNQTIQVNCNTSTLVGTFKLIVRGRLKDGTFFFSEKQFEVRSEQYAESSNPIKASGSTNLAEFEIYDVPKDELYTQLPFQYDTRTKQYEPNWNAIPVGALTFDYKNNVAYRRVDRDTNTIADFIALNQKTLQPLTGE